MDHKRGQVLTANILVVDNLSKNTETLRNALISEGYKVRSASNGSQIHEAIVIEKPDLILLDLKMPDINAHEVFTQLQKNDRSKDIPTIIVIDSTDTSGIVKAFRLGADDVISRPIRKEEVLLRVKTHLKQYLAHKKIKLQQAKLQQQVTQQTHELKKSKKVIDTSTEAIITGNLEGKIIYWNSAAEKLYGFKAEEAIGQPISLIYRKEDIPIIEVFTQRLLSGETIQNKELKAISKNNKELTVLLSLTTLKDSDGNVTELVGFSKDITERKKAQEELERLNMLFEDASAISKVGAWEFDIENGSNAFTKQTFDILELPHDELPTSEELFQYCHPEHRQKIRDSVNKAIENKESCDLEIKIITAKDNEIWVRFKANTISKSEKVTRLYGSIQDISDRKKVELELKKAQEIASIGSWYFDIQTGEITMAEELYKMYEIDPESPIPPMAEHEKFFEKESWKLLSESIENTIKTGDPYSIELKTKNKKGEKWQWFKGQGEAVYNREGKIIGLRGIAQDITKRKNTELDLISAKKKAESSEMKLLEAQAISHIGSWEYYVEPESVSWSKELFNIFELDGQSAPKYSDQKPFYTEKSFNLLNKAVQKCLEKGDPYNIELEIITSKGSKKHITSNGAPLRNNNNNKIIGCYGTAQDITERKIAEEKLRKSEEQRLKTRLQKQQLSNKIIENEKWLSMIINSIPGAVFKCKFDEDFSMNYMSPFIKEISGYDPQDFYPVGSLKFNELIIESDRLEIRKMLKKALIKNDKFKISFRIKNRNGKERWVMESGGFQKKGKVIFIDGVIIDVTDQIKANENVIKEIFEAEDKTRKEISQELHDGLQQSLLASKINFESVLSESNKLSLSLQNNLNVGYELLTKSISESRTISHNLMPKTVKDYGLVNAVKYLISNTHSGIKIKLNQNLNEKRFFEKLELGLYRIAQEALSNILKHSNSTEVFIQINCSDDLISLTIEDDGIGFDMDNVIKKNQGFGLLSMKSRASALGGLFEISSSPGNGTMIIVEIPLA